jgi:hypothetical protein
MGEMVSDFRGGMSAEYISVVHGLITGGEVWEEIKRLQARAPDAK